jgi:molybdenum cofactor cytidylyltransferase
MKALTVELNQAMGRILSCTLFRAGGKKLLARGHVISEEDARMLGAEGMSEVSVADLEEHEVGEDDAVMRVARELGCGSLEIRLAAGGRANLYATEGCCVLVDDELLNQINYVACIAIATVLNFSYARAGQRVASIKSVPFAVAKPELAAMLTIVRERGPVLQARPIRDPRVAILYTAPENGEQARQWFETIMRQRLDRFGTYPCFVLSSAEAESDVARSLQHLLRAKPTAVLIASTTAPAGPDDVIGRAMVRAGCHIERFLAPVEPGNLFLLGYKDDVPIVSAPGCFRSARLNVLDLMLPPMLSRYRISGPEVGRLGHGGLLG